MSKFYALLIALISLSINSSAQELLDKSYYRHFKVNVKNLTSDEYDELNVAIQEMEQFGIVSYCNANPGMLIQVNANYPARVKQIELEIQEFVSKKIASRRITSIENISDLDKINFCK